MTTFKKAFKDVYKETLSEEGFRYNSKYGFYMKLVNEELLEYITYIPSWTPIKGNKCFKIFAGIVSLYCDSVDKGSLRMHGVEFFFYSNDIKDKSGIVYNEGNMLDGIQVSLNKTKKYIIPAFHEVTDLDSYIQFRKKTGGIDAISSAKSFWADSLALIMADNHDDFQDVFQRAIFELKKEMETVGIGGTYEKNYDLLYQGIIKEIAGSRDEIYKDAELYKKAIEEAERRKQANLELLREAKVI